MTKDYKAALIIIGDELLSGRTQDINTQYIATALNEVGVGLSEVRIIPDDEDKIIETVHAVREEVDYLFTTGGIGPTHDDITAASMAKAFGVELEENAEAREILRAFYEGRGDRLTDARLKMACIPAGATLIPNDVSGAPGFILGNVYVMAGIPKVMQSMMGHIVQSLEGGAKVVSRTIQGECGESDIAAALEDIQQAFLSVSIGSYPRLHDGTFTVRIVLRSSDVGALDDAEKRVEDMLDSIGARAQENDPQGLDHYDDVAPE